MTNLPEIVTESDTLHTAIPTIKTEQSIDRADEEILKRKRFITDMRKMLREERKMKKAIEIDALRRQAEVQDTMDALSGLIALHEDDTRELTDYKWQLVDEKKDAKLPKSSNS